MYNLIPGASNLADVGVLTISAPKALKTSTCEKRSKGNKTISNY